MAVDTRGFINQPQDLSYLMSASNQLGRQRMIKEARDERRYGERQQTMADVSKLLNQRERFTGSKFDPEIDNLLRKARGDAYRMLSSGAGYGDIMNAVNDTVGQISDYQSKAKRYSEYKKQFADGLKDRGGYNVQNVGPLIDRYMFYNEDGTQKKLSDVDVDSFFDVANKAIVDNPEATVNFNDVANYLKKSPITSSENTIFGKDPKGRQTTQVVGVQSPQWSMLDPNSTDNNRMWVPKFEEHQTVRFDFSVPGGGKKSYPVRMVTQDVYNNVVENFPGVEAVLAKRIRDAGYQGDLNQDERTHDAAREELYDMLKPYAFGRVDESRPTIINIRTGDGGTSKKEDDAQALIRVYPDIEATVNDIWKKQARATNLNEIDDMASDIIMSKIRRKTGLQSLPINAIQLRPDRSGNMSVIASQDIVTGVDNRGNPTGKYPAGYSFGNVSKLATELAANKPTGVKGAREVVKEQVKEKYDVWRKRTGKVSFTEYQKYLNE